MKFGILALFLPYCSHDRSDIKDGPDTTESDAGWTVLIGEDRVTVAAASRPR